MSDDRKDKWDTFFDIAEDARDLLKSHEGEIRSLVGANETISLEDSEPLTSIIKNEDGVIIEMEVREAEGVSDLSFRFEDDSGKLTVSSSGNKTVFKLPEDMDVDNMDVGFSNGVLSMEIPREGRELDVGGEDDDDIENEEDEE